jgi:Flp pilus assembly pilin Flp
VIGRFLADRRGATSIEYAVLATLICVAIVAGVSAYASKVQAILSTVSASAPS